MASMIVTFPTVWSHLIGQLLYYMGENNIVFGSDSLWYGGPQWQIDALWRFQIPEDIRQKWNYPQVTESAKRKILGLNSARLYGLPAAAKPLGSDGGVYKQGNLANYASFMQPGSAIDGILRGPGYPTPVVPAQSPVALLRNDRLTKMKKQYAEMGGGRDNTRFGWMRSRT
jgi:hypothetical protein